MGLLIFIPAGTVAYWQAWAYLVIFFGSSLLITLYLMRKDPALLRRRVAAGPTKETTLPQRIVMYLASLAFIALLVVPALGHRFDWLVVPAYVELAGDVFVAVCFYVQFLVFKENTFASATVEIARDQRVIATGPYAFIRHPMYAGALLLFIGTPLALGSYCGLVAFFVVLPVLIWRLLDEEKLLANELPGYTDYCARVRWRLIRGIF